MSSTQSLESDDSVGSIGQYLVFDLNGQNVAVTEVHVDETGGLKATWHLLDKKKKLDDAQIEDMLNDAFKFILEKCGD